MNTTKTFSSDIVKQLEYLKPGNTVKVYFKIKEGDKSRVQVFEGRIINVKIATRVRRANLSYLRDRDGKKAKLPETVLNTKLEVFLKEEEKTEEPQKEVETKVVETEVNTKKETEISESK